MTWTYDSTLSTALAKVRTLIGDIDTTDQQVSDEIVAFHLSQQSNNLYRTASAVARAIAAKYSRDVSIGIGSLKVNSSDLSEKYLKLALQLEIQAQTAPGGFDAVVSGVSIDAMEDADEDSDRPKPSFRIGQDSPTPVDDGE